MVDDEEISRVPIVNTAAIWHLLLDETIDILLAQPKDFIWGSSVQRAAHALKINVEVGPRTQRILPAKGTSFDWRRSSIIIESVKREKGLESKRINEYYLKCNVE